MTMLPPAATGGRRRGTRRQIAQAHWFAPFDAGCRDYRLLLTFFKPEASTTAADALRRMSARRREPNPCLRILAMSAIEKSHEPMKRCPAAEGVVIASSCSVARSRTSTTLKPKRGKAGIDPSKSFLTAYW